MTDTNNPRPWRDRITVDGALYKIDGGLMSGEQWFDALRGLLDEAHALAAEVERLRTQLTNPTDGPLRVERNGTSNPKRPHYLLRSSDVLCTLTDEQADAIEAQFAARPAHDGAPSPFTAKVSGRDEVTGAASVQFSHPDFLLALRVLHFRSGEAADEFVRRLTAPLPAAPDLPDGVQPWTAAPIEIDGVPVVGVAMGDVVQGLSDDEWLRASGNEAWFDSRNVQASDQYVYLLGRKPTPTPPTERVPWGDTVTVVVEGDES